MLSNAEISRTATAFS